MQRIDRWYSKLHGRLVNGLMPPNSISMAWATVVKSSFLDRRRLEY